MLALLLGLLSLTPLTGAIDVATVDVAGARPETPIAPELRRIEPKSFAGFVENLGQWDPGVRFATRVGNQVVSVLDSGFVVRSLPPRGPDAEGGRMQLDGPVDELAFLFAGGNRASSVIGFEPGTTLHHFLLGENKTTNARGFASVVLEDVLPGLDVRLRLDGEQLAYDLLAEAGVRSELLEIQVLGASRIESLGAELVVEGVGGVLTQRLGASWELDADGMQRPVTPFFAICTERELRYSIAVPCRNLERALVIDPTLTYGSYLGNDAPQFPDAFAVGPDGSIYASWYDFFGSFIGTTGTIQPHNAGSTDVVVAKLSAEAADLEWVTFLGGANADNPVDLLPDADSLTICGLTWSPNFPTTPGVLQPDLAGTGSTCDTFVASLSLDGTTLNWSTLFGDATNELTLVASLADNGDVMIAIDVLIGAFGGLPPTYAVSPGAFDTSFDPDDKLILRVAAGGTHLIGSTWFHTARILDCDIGPDGGFYVCGNISPEVAPLPQTPGVMGEDYPTPFSKGYGYAAKFDASCTQLEWSTMIGGQEGADTAWSIAVDRAGCSYLAFQAGSSDMPVTPGAHKVTTDDQTNGAIAKLLPNATACAWFTYLGDWNQSAFGYTSTVVVDAAGNPTALGYANSIGWPTTPDAFQTIFYGPFPDTDLGLTKFDALGEQLVYSTLFGGASGESFNEAQLDEQGNLHFVMQTFSPNLPATPGAFGQGPAGSTDLYVAGFDLGLLPWRLLGYGQAGSREVPNLVGIGSLQPGAPTRLAVRGAEPNLPVWIAVGFSELYLPLFGATLVPSPDAVLALKSDSLGWAEFSFAWPNAIQTGSVLTFQAWCLDPLATNFLGVSNGLRAIAQ